MLKTIKKNIGFCLCSEFECRHSSISHATASSNKWTRVSCVSMAACLCQVFLVKRRMQWLPWRSLKACAAIAHLLCSISTHKTNRIVNIFRFSIRFCFSTPNKSHLKFTGSRVRRDTSRNSKNTNNKNKFASSPYLLAVYGACEQLVYWFAFGGRRDTPADRHSDALYMLYYFFIQYAMRIRQCGMADD